MLTNMTHLVAIGKVRQMVKLFMHPYSV